MMMWRERGAEKECFVQDWGEKSVCDEIRSVGIVPSARPIIQMRSVLNGRRSLPG